MVEELTTSSTSLESIQTDFQAGVVNALQILNAAKLESEIEIQYLLQQTTEASLVRKYFLLQDLS